MYQHTRQTAHHLHGIRVLLFGVLFLALFLVRVNPSGLSASTAPAHVLAYATNINRSDLLSATNSYRAQNGLGPLASNDLLHNSSQNKAQHMVDNDYWAHVAPDGTQPWYFFEQAGYDYSAAGENLAYGFSTSASTVDAWMNSSSHRANILGDYVDVGFGMVNGPSYQGGENTVVVAHYGTPRYIAPAEPTAPQPTAPTPSPQPAEPEPTATPQPETVTPPETPAETEATSPVPAAKEDKATEAPAAAPALVATGTARSVTMFEKLKFGNVSALALTSLTMTVMTAIGFALTHRSLVRHAVVSGEKFAMHHPAIDMSAVIIISILILATTMGRIG